MPVTPESKAADSREPSSVVNPTPEHESTANPVDLAAITHDSLVGTSLQGEFEFPGVLASVPEHREKMMEFISPHCPDEGDCIDIMVALQEALANAALHGCKDDPAKRIHCLVTIDGSEIQITVRDPGPGFDASKADPEKYQATTLSHGRGICLMRSLVTDVAFAHHGAEICLRKRLSRTH